MKHTPRSFEISIYMAPSRCSTRQHDKGEPFEHFVDHFKGIRYKDRRKSADGGHHGDQRRTESEGIGGGDLMGNRGEEAIYVALEASGSVGMSGVVRRGGRLRGLRCSGRWSPRCGGRRGAQGGWPRDSINVGPRSRGVGVAPGGRPRRLHGPPARGEEGDAPTASLRDSASALLVLRAPLRPYARAVPLPRLVESRCRHKSKEGARPQRRRSGKGWGRDIVGQGGRGRAATCRRRRGAAPPRAEEAARLRRRSRKEQIRS